MPQCSAALESDILHLASLRPGALAHILTNDNRKAAVHISKEPLAPRRAMQGTLGHKLLQLVL